jgi:hypothetical protein
MKFITTIMLTVFFVSQLEEVHCSDILDRLKAEIALRNIYLDFVMKFQNENDESLKREEFARQLKDYAHKRMENEKLNNFWRLRQG